MHLSSGCNEGLSSAGSRLSLVVRIAYLVTEGHTLNTSSALPAEAQFSNLRALCVRTGKIAQCL